MASITPHKDGFRAFVYVKGKRATKVFQRKRDAQTWAMKKEAELEALAGLGAHTFHTAVVHYLETVSAHKRSPEWERRRFMAMLNNFGHDTYLAQIDSARIGQWRDERLKTVSGSTVQREANLLRHLFSLAADEWRWLDRNPFRGVRLPKESEPRHQVWKWQQIKRVLRHPCSGKTAEVVYAFHVALHTGLRLQEVITGRYDPARRVIDLEKTKTGGRVSVPVTRRAMKVLPWKGTVDANEASVLFSKLTRSLLIEGLTFHDSRATALTLLSRKMDVMTLARISRHRDLRTLLNTYYRESAEQIAARI